MPEVDFAVVDRVSEIATERGVPMAQVALAWLLHKPGVTAPIVGATKAEHFDDALAAERLALSDDEIALLEEPYVPHKVSGIAIQSGRGMGPLAGLANLATTSFAPLQLHTRAPEYPRR